MIILLIIIISIIAYFSSNIEHFNPEAIKNIASIYNNKNMTLDNLNVKNDLNVNNLISISSKNKKAYIINRDGKFVLNNNGDRFSIQTDGNIGGDDHVLIDRYVGNGGMFQSLSKGGHNNPHKIRVTSGGGNVKGGCPNTSNWTVVCPGGYYMIGLARGCEGTYPICKKFV